jgi:Golgi apparatus protein 1
MDDGLEDFADFNDFGATPVEGGAGAATPATGTPAAAAPAGGAAPASGTAAPSKTSTSNRQKKAPSTNKIVGFAPEANITFGDDIDDEGEGCSADMEREAHQVGSCF